MINKIHISQLNIEHTAISNLDVANKFNTIVSHRGSGKTELAKAIYAALELSLDDLFIISPSDRLSNCYTDVTNLVRHDTTDLNKMITYCMDPNLMHRKKLLVLDDCFSSTGTFLTNPDANTLELFKNLNSYNTTIILLCQFLYLKPENLDYAIDNWFFGGEDFPMTRDIIYKRVFKFIEYRNHFHEFFLNNTKNFKFVYLKGGQTDNYFVKIVKTSNDDVPTKKINSILN
jgi:hypothetical protein